MSLVVESESPDQTAHAQSHFGFRCPIMPKDTFLHGVAYV